MVVGIGQHNLVFLVGEMPSSYSFRDNVNVMLFGFSDLTCIFSLRFDISFDTMISYP
jgi:hypothetical protein